MRQFVAGETAVRFTPDLNTDKLVFRDLYRFDRSYWYIVGLCVVFYSAIFPFRAFAIKYFIEAHGATRGPSKTTYTVDIIMGGVGYELVGNTITSSMDVLNYPLAAALSSIVVIIMLLLMLSWYLIFDMSTFLGKILEWRG